MLPLEYLRFSFTDNGTMKTWLRYILWFTIGFTVVGLALGYGLWRGLSGSVYDGEETAYVYVRPDDTPASVQEQLIALGCGNTHLYWKVLNAARPYVLRTGRYAVKPGQSFLITYLRLKSGQQTPVMLTVPSVRSLKRLAGSLSHKLMLDSAEIVRNLSDSAYIAQYGYTSATLPALFIPNTYEVYWDTSLDTFMQRMQRENARFWEQNGRSQAAQALGMTREEVVTLASIVDEETADNAEKPRVAGLYLNRIRKGIHLQADPTVKFAAGDETLRRIRNEHLRIDHPYNTYIYKGLPPGPIRIASVASIDAVLHPELHNYLYMCAKEDFSGTHNFAATFVEHKQNARRYQRALNERNIR